VIVFDPKGDIDLLRRAYAETKRAGREGQFFMFHLGHPDLSARYNPVGNFSRITEVATRIAGQHHHKNAMPWQLSRGRG
jgi:type IV secretory pathway TraG/TraD family ATPase VirD4